MATTTDGFPYPPASDALGNGHQWIEDLAEFIDTQWVPWTAYTPGLTNVTVGTGAGGVTGAYRRLMDTVDFRMVINLGTGGNVTSNIHIDYAPAGLDPSDIDQVVGQVVARDSSTGLTYIGALIGVAGGVGDPVFHGAAGGGDVTVPFDWASDDTITIQGRYRLA